MMIQLIVGFPQKSPPHVLTWSIIGQFLRHTFDHKNGLGNICPPPHAPPLGPTESMKLYPRTVLIIDYTDLLGLPISLLTSLHSARRNLRVCQ